MTCELFVKRGGGFLGLIWLRLSGYQSWNRQSSRQVSVRAFSLPGIVLPGRRRQRGHWLQQSHSAASVRFPDRWSCLAPHLEVLTGGQRLTCLMKRQHRFVCP